MPLRSTVALVISLTRYLRLSIPVVVVLGCAGAADSSAPAITPAALTATYNGDATYYAATGKGSCGGEATSDLHVAALAQPSWAGASFCGACAQVTGPKGHTFVRIVDMCPECKDASLDLGEPAFAELDKLSVGRIPITWKLAPCPVQGPVQYYVVDGSSKYWIGIRVRHHRVPVASLELEVNGSFVALERKQWNDFVLASGVKTDGPFRVRVTAWSGQVLEDTLPGPTPKATFEGKAQFDTF